MRWLPLIVFATAVLSAAPESERWLHLNGYSHHFAAPDANSKLWGVGFSSRTRSDGTLLWSWEGDVFSDSACKPSAYVGKAAAVRMGPSLLGVTGAAMYHRNFRAENRLRVLPVAFPFWEIGSKTMRTRIYYVPGLRRRTDEQIAVQFMLSLDPIVAGKL